MLSDRAALIMPGSRVRVPPLLLKPWQPITIDLTTRPETAARRPGGPFAVRGMDLLEQVANSLIE